MRAIKGVTQSAKLGCTVGWFLTEPRKYRLRLSVGPGSMLFGDVEFARDGSVWLTLDETLGCPTTVGPCETIDEAIESGLLKWRELARLRFEQEGSAA